MGFSERGKFATVVLSFQVVFIVLFAVLSDYSDSANAQFGPNSRDHDKNGTDHDKNMIKDFYPMFQDVHVMMFIGFGFLMTFMKRYGFSSVGLNMLIAAFVIEWALLFKGILAVYWGHGGHHGPIQIDIVSMLNADFTAATVLITFGALLGKTSPLQMIIIAFIEVIVFSINEHIGLEYFKAVDVGGSMFVHVFGAYFGLACARVIFTKDVHDTNNEGSVYHSDIFAMIGTIFLWMFWPSFNSALAVGDDQHRAVINTYIALAACCVVTFAISALLEEKGKFDMVHIQNATLAGGVAVGTSADMMVHPYGAAIIGTIAAVISVVGYAYLTPFLNKRAKIHDTCGVNNLHGMPGVYAGVTGAVVSALATVNIYGYSLYEVFPARAPLANTTELHKIQEVFSFVEAGDDRSAGVQAAFQLAALGLTLLMAIVFGALTGIIVKIPVFDQPQDSMDKPIMDDDLWWGTPDDYDAPTRRTISGLMKGEDEHNNDINS